MSDIVDIMDAQPDSDDGFELIGLPESPPPRKKSRSESGSVNPMLPHTNSAVSVSSDNHFEDFSIPACVLKEFTSKQLARIFPVQIQPNHTVPEESQEVHEHPFVSKMKEHAIAKESDGNISGQSQSLNTSGYARLDFFFKVMEKTFRDKTVDLFRLSWAQDPLDTLRLLAYLRDRRGGKGVRTPYQACLYWLYANHPRTLEHNLGELSTFGYWKDLLHFLMTICFEGVLPYYLELDDSYELKNAKRMANKKIESTLDNLTQKFQQTRITSRDFNGLPHCPRYTTRKEVKRALRLNRWDLRQCGTYNKLVLEYTQKNDPTFHPKVNRPEFLSRQQRKEMILKFARRRLETDAKYRYFHVKIAQLFAEQLKLDRENLVEERKNRISFAPKFAPSLKNHFDKYTLIGTTIALKLMRIEGHEIQMHKPCDAVRAYLSRQKYQKEYLVKMRKALQVPEINMAAGKWGQINYKRVPALCMRRFNKLFLKHDHERFENFVQSNMRIAGAAIKPVEIVTKLLELDESATIEIDLLEKQWASMVESVRGRGKAKTLSNALAVCDVSGSMEGEPMRAAVGLTLLTMGLSASPWNEVCITFHESPSVFQVPVNLPLNQKVKNLLSMDAGLNTDLNKIFNLLLHWALELKEETGKSTGNLPETILVFTDMEFDEAFPKTEQTHFEVMRKKFAEAGFKLPRIVFWNLRGGCAFCAAQEISPDSCDFCKGALLEVPSGKMKWELF